MDRQDEINWHSEKSAVRSLRLDRIAVISAVTNTLSDHSNPEGTKRPSGVTVRLPKSDSRTSSASDEEAKNTPPPRTPHSTCAAPENPATLDWAGPLLATPVPFQLHGRSIRIIYGTSESAPDP